MQEQQKQQLLDNSNISKHLGKSSDYACNYDPTLLVREPRSSNRIHLGIADDALPFEGTDTWNGYEVTGLTNLGLPVSLLVKFVYDASSKYIVESKSVKLYFNSFSMTNLGETVEDVHTAIRTAATRDLSTLLETPVYVEVFSDCFMLMCSTVNFNSFEEYHKLAENDNPTKQNSYITIEDVYPVSGVQFTAYQEDPSLLRVVDSEVGEVFYHSSLLRSRCRVTSQPDSGDVFIHIKGGKTVDPISLLEYIVSFRDECHFHEEICEAIYTRLSTLLKPEALAVRCLYARRGGWDINPERVSDKSVAHYCLSDTSCIHVKTPKQ